MRTLHSRSGCHCVFGWAQVMFSPRFLDRFWRGKFAKRPDSEDWLFGLLGMSYAEGRRLYHVNLWPEDLRTKYQSAYSDKTRAEVTAEAIDRFIADPGFKNDGTCSWVSGVGNIAEALV